MNPEVLRLVNNLPRGINPVNILIEDETRFLHSLGQHSGIAWPGQRGEDTIRTIALAAGTAVNRRAMYYSFLDYMPDKQARDLLEGLLAKVDTLVETTFGKSRKKMQSLAGEREKYCKVMDDIFMAYSALTTYLRPKATSNVAHNIAI